MRRRLAEKRFAPADVERVVAILLAQGLLDDARFARAVAEDTLARKPVGQRWLRAKLMEHLVPEDIAGATLADLLPKEREAELARTAAEAKRAELARYRGLADEAQLSARLFRFLLARGFPPAVVRDAVTAVVG